MTIGPKYVFQKIKPHLLLLYIFSWINNILNNVFLPSPSIPLTGSTSHPSGHQETQHVYIDVWNCQTVLSVSRLQHLWSLFVF